MTKLNWSYIDKVNKKKIKSETTMYPKRNQKAQQVPQKKI